MNELASFFADSAVTWRAWQWAHNLIFGLLLSLFLFLLCPRMASVSQFTAEQAMVLLDFGSKMDMTLLDSVVSCFYNTVGPQVRQRVYITSS